MKSNVEMINELVGAIIETVSHNMGASSLMLAPAINILKMKLRSIDEDDANTLVNTIHAFSRKIEVETGRLSSYHGNRSEDEIQLRSKDFANSISKTNIN